MTAIVGNGGGPTNIATTSAGSSAGLVIPGAGANLDINAFPEDRYDQTTATIATTGLGDTYGEITDQDVYEGLIFIPTTSDVTLEITLDGATWIAAHPFIDMGVAARTGVATTVSNVGPFLMNTPCRGFRFANAAAAISAVTYAQVGKVGI